MAISITINGKKEEVENGLKIIQLLEKKSIKPEVVAVELNGDIVNKKDYGGKALKDKDILEFVYYMGGGSIESRPKRSGEKIADSVLDLIGNTPLVRLNKVVESGMAQIYAKLESANPGGSLSRRRASLLRFPRTGQLPGKGRK